MHRVVIDLYRYEELPTELAKINAVDHCRAINLTPGWTKPLIEEADGYGICLNIIPVKGFRPSIGFRGSLSEDAKAIAERILQHEPCTSRLRDLASYYSKYTDKPYEKAYFESHAILSYNGKLAQLYHDLTQDEMVINALLRDEVFFTELGHTTLTVPELCIGRDKVTDEFITYPFHCPTCSSPDVQVVSYDWEGGGIKSDTLIRSTICEECGTTADELYTLTGVRDIKSKSNGNNQA